MATVLKIICTFAPTVAGRLCRLPMEVDLLSGKRKVRATQSTILANSELSATAE